MDKLGHKFSVGPKVAEWVMQGTPFSCSLVQMSDSYDWDRSQDLWI